MLEGVLDFDIFRDNSLTITGELSETIVCIFPCSERCRVRKIVKAPNGKIRAVCSRNENDYFHVSVEDIIVYRLDINALVEALAAALKNEGFKRPEPYLLPEISIPVEEEILKPAYPIQHVFPFAKRHIYKEVDEESEKWYVDGKFKKVYGPKKKNCMQSKILNILYNQIGNGWVPHETFIYATGWTENEYFGKDRNNPGRMQRLLFQLRKKLKIKIEFNKNLGVKFPDDVARATSYP